LIRISKKVDYSIIILSHLALHQGAPVSAREIARQYGISYALVANLLKTLAGAGWIVSVRGMKGGYAIRRQAAEVNLDELIEVIEGPYRFADCAGGGLTPSCVTAQNCPACDVIRRVHDEIRQTFRRVTIADLAGHGGKKGFQV
jgi:Rrf2 family transcriptional regulator, cysteine metabolism repressor